MHIILRLRDHLFVRRRQEVDEGVSTRTVHGQTSQLRTLTTVSYIHTSIPICFLRAGAAFAKITHQLSKTNIVPSNLRFGMFN